MAPSRSAERHSAGTRYPKGGVQSHLALLPGLCMGSATRARAGAYAAQQTRHRGSGCPSPGSPCIRAALSSKTRWPHPCFPRGKSLPQAAGSRQNQAGAAPTIRPAGQCCSPCPCPLYFTCINYVTAEVCGSWTEVFMVASGTET